jgi:hypothetical protein
MFEHGTSDAEGIDACTILLPLSCLGDLAKDIQILLHKIS